MEIYEVVPYAAQVESFIAKIGWEVYVSLPAAIKELEDQLRNTHFQRKTVIKRAIPIDHHFQRCNCVIGNHCTCDGWVALDELMQRRLMRDLSGWSRVTREDYDACRVQEAMLGHPLAWLFEDRWLPLLPSSDTPPNRVSW